MRPASPAWSSADLTRRLCNALDIAEQAIARLASEGYVDAIDPALSVRPEKVVSETAVLLLAASAVKEQPALGERLDQLARLLAPHARSPRMRAGVCFEPALALDYAQAHGCLLQMGYADPGFDALLRAAAQSQAFAVRERTPHRALEQRWVAELCGLDSALPPPSRHALASMSALGKPLDLLGGSREDIYAYTHALMYLNDPHLSRKRRPRSHAGLLADAEAALARCVDDEDYDLAGELLLAWPLTGARWSATAAFAFQTLALVEEEAGFLPSAGTRLAHLDRLSGKQRADCLLASAYHTIYVMGLLCAASLAPGRAPPTRPRGSLRWASRADEIHATLCARDKAPHWSSAYARLAPAERGSLVGFLLSVALRRAVRARDLAAVHELLHRAVDADLANGPLWSQAAELLERAAVHASQTAPQASQAPAALAATG
jgi:hypothetical protein